MCTFCKRNQTADKTHSVLEFNVLRYKKNLNPTLVKDLRLLNLCKLMSTLKFRKNKELSLLIYTKKKKKYEPVSPPRTFVLLSKKIIVYLWHFYQQMNTLYLYLVVLLVLNEMLKCTGIIREVGDTANTWFISNVSSMDSVYLYLDQLLYYLNTTETRYCVFLSIIIL